jgi:hypothetical protein
MSYRAVAVRLGVVPPKKEAGTTAAARAPRPTARFALRGATPMPRAAERPKVIQRVNGRSGDGAACIGCIHYKPLYRDGYLFGRGACKSSDGRIVAARDRQPCAFYLFYGRAQR